MSTVEEKRLKFLAKRQKQLQQQEVKMLTVPTAKKKKRKFVPTKKVLAKESQSEEKMRQFLTSILMIDKVIDKTEDVKGLDYKVPKSQIVKNGFLSFLRYSVSTKDDTESSENARIRAAREWYQSDTDYKIKWILHAYGDSKDAEYGRKQFINNIIKFNPGQLKKFITTYLKYTTYKYKDFYDSYSSTKEIKIQEEPKIVFPVISEKVRKEMASLKKKEQNFLILQKIIRNISLNTMSTSDLLNFIPKEQLVQYLSIELKEDEEKLLMLPEQTLLKKYKNYLTPQKLKNIILNYEYPRVGEQLSRSEMKDVLPKISLDNLKLLATGVGIDNTEDYKSKVHLQSTILNKLYPIETKLYVKKKYTKDWSSQRLSELSNMTTKELYRLGYIMDINMTMCCFDKDKLIAKILLDEDKYDEKELSLLDTPELLNIAKKLNVLIFDYLNTKQLIMKILEIEEDQGQLVINKDVDKKMLIDKISNITKRPQKIYFLWSIEALESYEKSLSEVDLDDKEWVEIEQKRLLSKLAEISTKDYTSLNVLQLAQELENLLGSNWKTYTPITEDYSFINCVKQQMELKYPWIPASVKGVWLSSPNEKELDDKWVYKNKKIIENKKSWYEAKKQFFILQCNQYKNERTQIGNILKCKTNDGKIVQFSVGYTVIDYYGSDKLNVTKNMISKKRRKQIKEEVYDPETKQFVEKISAGVEMEEYLVQRTFITQNEVLFNMEKQYFNQVWKNKINETTNKLNKLVNTNSINASISLLSEYLTDIAPDVIDYRLDSDFNKIVINSLRPYNHETKTFKKQLNRNLFKKLAEILVYLKVPEAITFQDRIKKQYYLPDVLHLLSIEEKFPEAYNNPNVAWDEEIDIADVLLDMEESIVNLLVEKLDITRRRKTMPVFSKTSFTLPSRKLACENKLDPNIKETDLIYYKHGEETYCFTIDQLHTQFLDNNIINPYTNEEFSTEFIARFNKIYNKKLSTLGLVATEFQEKYNLKLDEKIQKTLEIKEKPVLAPNLLDLIGKDITELEDELTNEPPKEGDIIDENREIERRQDEYIELKRDSPNVPQDKACEYCKKHIAEEELLKTIIKHGEESRIIKFCSFKCFEDKDDFKKIRKMKKRKRKKKEEKKEEKKVETPKIVREKTAREQKTTIDTGRKKEIEDLLKQGGFGYSLGLNKMTLEELKTYASKNFYKIKKNMTKNDIVKFLVEERKKEIKKYITELTKEEKNPNSFRIALPLMTIQELTELAKKKKIDIKGKFVKKDNIISGIFKAMFPQAANKSGVYSSVKANEELGLYIAKQKRKRQK